MKSTAPIFFPFISITYMMRRKRQNGDDFAPDLTDSANKRFKAIDESLAYDLMYDVFYYLKEYDYLPDAEIHRGSLYSQHFSAVHELLSRDPSIFIPLYKFEEAASRIRQKFHSIYNIFDLVANEVIELILEENQAIQMKQRDLYYRTRMSQP